MPETEPVVPNNGLFRQTGEPRFRGRFYVRFVPGRPFCAVDVRGGRDFRTEVRLHCPHGSLISSRHRQRFAKLFGHGPASIHEVKGVMVDGHRFTGLRIFLFGRLSWLEGGVEPGGSYEFFECGGSAPEARGTALGGAGLFKAHIRPREFRPGPRPGIPRDVTVYPRGQILEVGSWTWPLGIRPSGGSGGGLRGPITGFSRESRMRLLKAVCKLSIVPENCLFMTLTYPAEFPDDVETINAHFAAFVKRLRRAFPDVSGYAKIEPQKRGAPHWHLLLMGERFSRAKLESVRRWTARAWYEVVGSGDARHLRAGTQVKVAQGVKGTLAYLCKYLGKECSGLPAGMRYWRVINSAALPRSEAVKVELSDAQGVRMKRLLRKLIRSKARGQQVNRLRRKYGQGVRWQTVLGHCGLKQERHRDPAVRASLLSMRREACRGWKGDRLGSCVIADGAALKRLLDHVIADTRPVPPMPPLRLIRCGTIP